MTSFLKHLSLHNLTGVAIGPALALLLFRAKAPWSRWVIVATLLIVPTMYMLISPLTVREGVHGFMQVAFVNAASRNMPPEDPMFAGALLRYPYVPHMALGWISSIMSVPAMDAMAVLSILSLIVLLLSTLNISSQLGFSHRGAAWGVLLSTTGLNVILSSPVGLALYKLAPILGAENRIQAIDKLLAPNLFGLVGYAGWLLCLFQVLRGSTRLKLWLAASIPCAFLGVILYPMTAVVLAVSMGAAWCAWLFERDRTLAVRLLLVSAALLIAALPCVPHALSITVGKSRLASFIIQPPDRFMITKISMLTMFLLFPMTLAYLGRDRLQSLWRTNRSEMTVMGLTVLGMSALYVFVRYPSNCDYKWLLYASLPLGLVTGELGSHVAGSKGARWKAVLVWCGLSLVLMGQVRSLVLHLSPQHATPILREGSKLFPAEPAWNAICQAIDRATPIDAVIVSQSSLFSALANRSLFVAMEQDVFDAGNNGWGQPETVLLEEVLGHEKADVDRRRALVTEIIAPTWVRSGPEVLKDIEREVPGRPVFVVAETSEGAAKLRSTPGLEPWVYAGSEGGPSVFRLVQTPR